MTFALTAQPENADDTPVTFPLLRSVGMLSLVVLVPGGLISVGLELLKQPIVAQVNILAVLICIVGCVFGFLPVWLLSKQHRHGAAQGFMAGMMLRILICAAAYFALQWGGYPHTGLLVYFLAGWYLVTLMVEVKMVSSFLLAHAVAPAPGSDLGTGQPPADQSSAAPLDQNATAPTGRVGLEGDV